MKGSAKASSGWPASTKSCQGCLLLASRDCHICFEAAEFGGVKVTTTCLGLVDLASIHFV